MRILFMIALLRTFLSANAAVLLAGRPDSLPPRSTLLPRRGGCPTRARPASVPHATAPAAPVGPSPPAAPHRPAPGRPSAGGGRVAVARPSPSWSPPDRSARGRLWDQHRRLGGTPHPPHA